MSWKTDLTTLKSNIISLEAKSIHTLDSEAYHLLQNVLDGQFVIISPLVTLKSLQKQLDKHSFFDNHVLVFRTK